VTLHTHRSSSTSGSRTASGPTRTRCGRPTIRASELSESAGGPFSLRPAANQKARKPFEIVRVPTAQQGRRAWRGRNKYWCSAADARGGAEQPRRNGGRKWLPMMRLTAWLALKKTTVQRRAAAPHRVRRSVHGRRGRAGVAQFLRSRPAAEHGPTVKAHSRATLPPTIRAFDVHILVSLSLYPFPCRFRVVLGSLSL